MNSLIQEENSYKCLYQIPPKNGCYVVLDTETKFLKTGERVLEISAFKIEKGKINGFRYNGFIFSNKTFQKKKFNYQGIKRFHYKKRDYHKNFFPGSKEGLKSFLHFVENCLIFSHNAIFDMNNINQELKYWGLDEIPIEKFRCTMRFYK